MKTIILVGGGLLGLALASTQSTVMVSAQNVAASVDSQRALINQYCVGCHNERVRSGGFSWTDINLARPEQNAERVEKVIRKVRSGMMPPARAPRPDDASLKAFAAGF